MRSGSRLFNGTKSAFATLNELAANKLFKITAIISPPRCGSTGAYMALAESPHISTQPCAAVFEPFTLRKGSWEEKLEKGSQHILNRLQLMQQQGIKPPYIILTKDIASFLPPPLCLEWQSLVENFVFLIDDPYKQSISFLDMLANGRRFGLKTADGRPLTDESGRVVMHPPQKTRELWKNASALLEEKDFKQTGWLALSQVLSLTDQHCQVNPHKRIAVVDSSLLKMMPTTILSTLTKQLIDFAYTETMAGPWTKANGKNFNHPNAPDYDPMGPDGITQSMWVGPVVRASTFSTPLTQVISPEAFPLALSQYILETSLPIYCHLINHPNAILFKDKNTLLHLLNLYVGKQNLTIKAGQSSFIPFRRPPFFHETCPINTVAVIQAMHRRQNSSDPALTRLSTQIKSQFSPFADAFSILEQHQAYSPPHLGLK